MKDPKLQAFATRLASAGGIRDRAVARQWEARELAAKQEAIIRAIELERAEYKRRDNAQI